MLLQLTVQLFPMLVPFITKFSVKKMVYEQLAAMPEERAARVRLLVGSSQLTFLSFYIRVMIPYTGYWLLNFHLELSLENSLFKADGTPYSTELRFSILNEIFSVLQERFVLVQEGGLGKDVFLVNFANYSIVCCELLVLVENIRYVSRQEEATLVVTLFSSIMRWMFREDPEVLQRIMPLFECPIRLVLECSLASLLHQLPKPAVPRVSINHIDRDVQQQILSHEFLKGADFLKHWPLAPCGFFQDKEFDPILLQPAADPNEREEDHFDDDFSSDSQDISEDDEFASDSDSDSNSDSSSVSSEEDGHEDRAEEGSAEIFEFDSPEAILLDSESIASPSPSIFSLLQPKAFRFVIPNLKKALFYKGLRFEKEFKTRIESMGMALDCLLLVLPEGEERQFFKRLYSRQEESSRDTNNSPLEI